MKYSALQVRANPPGIGKQASKLALILAAQVRARQRGPVRTTPAAIYPQQQNMSSFYKNVTRHTHSVCLDNERSLEQVLSVQWLYL